jgi:2-oxoisovalerate ferredoxin oxidoreductase beta subunit
MSTFFERFERHAHGEGIKGQSSHYCPGCGHGLIHKYVAAAIEELAVQERTVMVSPVGCGVFLYYYFDTGNTQAAHGRAPAVAVGHKLANPEAIVVSYQGDGDLASIGLAEIVSVAQMGVPISVIFVNNAVYGMTGGQLAPTTLMGQRTSTSPAGRGREMGAPLKMAELIAQLDGPVYVERVALYDNKQRVKAQKAVSRALRTQVEGRGFAFVEVLAECPTHLQLTPEEAERWVRENLVPVFPLGVKKDVAAEPWTWSAPSHDGALLAELVGGAVPAAPRHCPDGYRVGVDGKVAIKMAGAGGDGAQTAALLVARTAINEGLDATHIPSYGPESRGGTSYADVSIAEGEVLSPAAPEPDVLVAFNAPSLVKFGPRVAPGGVVIFDSSVIAEPPALDPRVTVHGVPLARIAVELGQPVVKNIVALGALQQATKLFPKASFLAAIRRALGHKTALIPVNEAAFARGAEAIAAAADLGVDGLWAEGSRAGG